MRFTPRVLKAILICLNKVIIIYYSYNRFTNRFTLSKYTKVNAYVLRQCSVAPSNDLDLHRFFRCASAANHFEAEK